MKNWHEMTTDEKLEAIADQIDVLSYMAINLRDLAFFHIHIPAGNPVIRDGRLLGAWRDPNNYESQKLEETDTFRRKEPDNESDVSTG